MRKKKRQLIDEQRHNYDARSHKLLARIDWFDIESSWATPTYELPAEYDAFFVSFQSTIQETIDSIDIDGKQNGNVLDGIIDSEAHFALRQLKQMRIKHLHSLMEIAASKEAHLCQIKEAIALLECEAEKIKKELKEEES